MSAITNPITATTTPVTSSSSSTTSSSTNDQQMIANNFNTFLQLLTTQLKNQDPLSPMDTNQFTQQLVEFAQVEQQMKSNTELTTLVSLQQTAQDTAALNYVGQTVVLDGSTTSLDSTNGATWTLTSPKPASATVTITDANGTTAYSQTVALSSGTQTFKWNGTGSDGKQWPAGNYTMAVTAKDATGTAVSVSTEVHAVVDSVDLTQNPPTLSVAGQTFPMTKVKEIVRSGT
ncbi:MAG TPA: flagellar hook capping FlgD N-terminal domain-containing protein [Pseudolabrys sp.]|nr:flagellar hook capping FlgD N-terminal domain-containing protein [Pseudolabrys sp.]